LIVPVFRGPKQQGDIASFDIAHATEALAKRGKEARICVTKRTENPDRRIGLLRRATAGHAAALPSPAMNSRRRISHPSLLDCWTAYRDRRRMSGLKATVAQAFFLQRRRQLVTQSRRRGSLRLDVSGADYLAPLLGFLDDEFAEGQQQPAASASRAQKSGLSAFGTSESLL
jgi:hypothetical protein